MTRAASKETHPVQVDLKSLDVLEKKIQRTVDLVTRLRDENRTLKAKVDDLESKASQHAGSSRELDAMKLKEDQLQKELKGLQDERRKVLARVDGLLENLERMTLD